MHNWNPVLNFFLEVKQEYIKQFQTADYSYTSGLTSETKTCIENWIEQLIQKNEKNSKYQEWQNMIAPLELNQCGDYILWRYGRYSNIYDGEQESSGEDFWDRYNGFYRECRSVVIDVVNDCLVLTPFKKFFNINELEETSLTNVQERIAQAQFVEFSDKLDGSMQSARYYKGDVLMAGSQAIDPKNSWRLADGYRMLKENPYYTKLLQGFPDFTFIFEYISLRDAHVVKYTKEQEGLYLIGARHVNLGIEIPYKFILNVGAIYHIPTTKLFNKTIDQVMNELDDKSSEEAEGFVINIDGWKCKLKYNDYVHIHKALSKLSSVNLIIRCIADDQYDDLLAKLPVAYHDRVKKVAHVVFDYIKNTEQQIERYYQEAPVSSKKEFMIWVNENIPNNYKGYLRAKYLGNSYNVIKSGNSKCPHYKRLKEMGVTNYSEIFAEE